MSTELANSTDSSAAVVASSSSVLARWRRVLGPIIPGLLLDVADLGSLTTRIGPWAGFPAGLVIGVWMSLFYPFGFGWRCVIAIASGLYTLAPGTEYIPLATILTCLGRFIESAPAATSVVSAENHGAAKHSAETHHAERSNEGVVAGVRTSPAGSRAACPECGATALRYGQVAQRFWPTGSSVWSKGHEVSAFVCLECGFVGHFLAATDLDQMRDSPS